MRRKIEDFHDGAKDGLEPLEPLDLDKIDDFDQLLRALGKTAFGARSLGEAAEVMAAMVQDPEVTVVGTFSGAMSVAKMGLLLCDMLDRGWLDVVITTGALVAHGFIENLGRAHYKYPPQRSDRELYLQGYNRIYDTLEMEANLDYAEEVVREVLEKLDHQEVWASASLCRELGRHLAGLTDQPGLLRNAFLKGVPVFIPAFTDSELGLDLAGYMARQALAAGQEMPGALTSLSLKFNPFLDLGSYAQRVLQAKKLGIFTGRGAPELGPAGGPLSGAFAWASGAQFAGSALPVRGAPLPRARALGGPERLYLSGRRLLGEVYGPGRRRPLCRGIVRRHHQLAPDHEGGTAATGEGNEDLMPGCSAKVL